MASSPAAGVSRHSIISCCALRIAWEASFSKGDEESAISLRILSLRDLSLSAAVRTLLLLKSLSRPSMAQYSRKRGEWPLMEPFSLKSSAWASSWRKMPFASSAVRQPSSPITIESAFGS